MAKAAGINGLAVASIATGGLMVYAGLTGRSVLATIHDLINGKPLSLQSGTMTILRPIHGQGVTPPGSAGNLNPNVANGGPISSPGSAGNLNPNVNGTGGSALGQRIAATAVQYQGAGYVFGGDPSKGIGNWDCSSFANFVIGAQCGAAIPWYPAGKYTGHGHGPASWEWLAWLGATTIGTKPEQAVPGDLCCWPTHIGIALGGAKMISAVGHAEGTQVGNIVGPKGEPLLIRRLKAAA